MRRTTDRDEDLAYLAALGDRTAQAELVRRFWPVAEMEAASYRIPGRTWEDRVSEALIALSRAVMSWRPDNGASLRTFIKRCIRNAMMTLWRESRRQGEVPQRALVGLSEPTDSRADATWEDGLAAPGGGLESVLDRIEALAVLGEIERLMATEVARAAAGLEAESALVALVVRVAREREEEMAADLAEMFEEAVQPSLFGPSRDPDQDRIRLALSVRRYLLAQREVIEGQVLGETSSETGIRIGLGPETVAAILRTLRRWAGSLGLE